MINDSNLINHEEMFRKLDQILVNKKIFCRETWLRSKVNELTSTNTIEEDLLKEINRTDINDFIDKERLEKYSNLKSHLDFATKLSHVNNKFLLFQITGNCNIAEPSNKIDKNGENLDVLDQFESKFLQGDEEVKKNFEKVVLKLQMTDGLNVCYGFEYETVKIISELLGGDNKFPKIIVGPNLEIRRGIIYLNNSNTRLL